MTESTKSFVKAVINIYHSYGIDRITSEINNVIQLNDNEKCELNDFINSELASTALVVI